MSNFSEVTYSANQVICEHPRIIINPLLPELVAKFRNYVFRGDYHRVNKAHVHYFSFDYRPFSIKRNNISTADLDSCFVVDDSTGETFPIYCLVPCNKCDVCKTRKINGFVQRCKFESMQYDCQPWFVTLTYDEEHLPSDGLCVRDVQLFLKRLRINLKRKGYPFLIRYVAVGEYGKNTHRAHYHLLIWNIATYTHTANLDVAKIIEKSWSNGFIQHRLVDCSNDKTFYYTSKYLRKDCFVPKGCNSPFCVSSNRHGGIGSGFIDKCSKELRRTLNIHFKYLNKWTNKLEDMVFSSYVLNRVFPSFHKSVPSILRRRLQDYSLEFSMFKRYFSNSLFYEQFQNQFNRFYSYFAPYTFFGEVLYTEIPRDSRPTISGLQQYLSQDGEFIERWYNRINFKEAEEIAQKRDRFIFRLFEHVQPVDIGARAYKCRRNFGLSCAREIL